MDILKKRSSGVLLHATSLPGPHGIGDLGPAAFHFVDWLVSAGQSVWQLLPTTPIGPGNSPYQSVSAFAGSPLMVALEPLIEPGWLDQPELPVEKFASHKVEFERIVPWRIAHLRKAAGGFFARATAGQREAFAAWRKQQSYWLDDYGLFMALETAHNGHPWWDWPKDEARRESATLIAARKNHADEIAFWEFVQWCFDRQMKQMKDYANQRGVFIMGDLPIFIAHHSADCWARPDLYYLDENFQCSVVAGVPPDSMAPLGQRWGNPLYRWDLMERENFSWWADRLHRALDQADVFRIDHFRGFAGYWEIPSTCPDATQGSWIAGPGKKLFDAIEKKLGTLPIVAEDLGLITPDVIELRDHCGFPGMKILQFGFGGDGSHEFLPHNYTPDCVVYSGTHDNDTARGWWNNAPKNERHFAETYLATGAESIHWGMIRGASNSVARMAVFPLQDILGLDSTHRMNIPGSVGGHNWSWRFTWDMIGSEPTKALRRIAASSGRAPFALMQE
ncbi:MAG: 4-alpha-glucanotransferase [Burkholderiales bacterium]